MVRHIGSFILLFVLLSMVNNPTLASNEKRTEQTRLEEKRFREERWDNYTNEWYRQYVERNRKLLTDGLNILKNLESPPTTDGEFSEYIAHLSLMPYHDEHLPVITRLMAKKDPYLKEAGVKLAWAAVHVNRYSLDYPEAYRQFEPALCRLLNEETMDPWVLKSVVKFAKGIDSRAEMPVFFHDLTKAVFENPSSWLITSDTKGPHIEREGTIQPLVEARCFLMQTLINHANIESSECQAVLTVMERVYGVKGIKAVRDKIENEVKGIPESQSDLDGLSPTIQRVRSVNKGWDNYSRQWYQRWGETNGTLLTHGLREMAKYEASPSSGLFLFAQSLATLPFREEHLPYIVRIVKKNDPFLMEVGVQLADAMMAQGNTQDREAVRSQLEKAFCKIMNKPLDPWIVFALTEFALHNDPDLRMKRFYKSLATCVLLKKFPTDEKTLFSYNSPMSTRQRWIEPSVRINFCSLMGRILLSPDHPAYKDVLNVLESVYKVKGVQNVRKKLRKWAEDMSKIR